MIGAITILPNEVIVIFVDTESKIIAATLYENPILKTTLGYLAEKTQHSGLITTTLANLLLDFFSEREGPNVRQEAIKFWT